MKVDIVKQAAQVTSSKLGDSVAAGTPIGEPVAQMSTLVPQTSEDGDTADIWECAPGKFRRAGQASGDEQFSRGPLQLHARRRRDHRDPAQRYEEYPLEQPGLVEYPGDSAQDLLRLLPEERVAPGPTSPRVSRGLPGQ